MPGSLPNPRQLVDESRIQGGGVNIGALGGKVANAAAGDKATARAIRDSVQPYLSVSERNSLDQLLVNSGAMNPISAPPPPAPPPPTPTPTSAPAPTAASFGWYNNGYLIGSIVNDEMIEPAADAPAEVKVAFYTSRLYLDFKNYKVKQTAAYSGGIDFLGDALTQARLTANAITAQYVGYSPPPTYQEYLQQLKTTLSAQQGINATLSQIDASLQHLRAISNGSSNTPATSPIDNGIIVVAAWRPPSGPGFTPPQTSPTPILPPAVNVPPPSGNGVTALDSSGVAALIQSGALTKEEVDAIKKDLDGKLARGEITAAQYDKQAEQRISDILEVRFPASRLTSDSPARALSPAELFEVKQRMGNILDPSKIRIRIGPGGNIIAWVALKVLGRPAITLGNTIYFNENYFTGSDFTTNKEYYASFMHEAGHVAQYQSKGFLSYFAGIVGNAVEYGANGAYEYWKRPSIPFSQQPLESQANIRGHLAFYLKYGMLPGDLVKVGVTVQQLLNFGGGSGVEGR